MNLYELVEKLSSLKEQGYGTYDVKVEDLDCYETGFTVELRPKPRTIVLVAE
jgi:hypothetical protein